MLFRSFILSGTGSFSACSKIAEVITPAPQITGITIDGIKATREGDKFSVGLSYSSPIDPENVKSDEIVFEKDNPQAKISPEGPYNFADAINSTIAFSISFNGQSSNYYLRLRKSVPPVPDEEEDSTLKYATWIMIWNGSTESWFNPESYNGATIWVNNTWKATDWNDNNQVDELVLNMKNAGIKVIICDLTNGFKWMNKVKYIQNLAAQYDMKVCVAENYGGKPETFETHAKAIYDNLSGPNAPNNSAYFKKDGKPLFVCYCTKPHYDALTAYSSTMRNYFNLVWSSGENSLPDKWGWQLDPRIGAEPSTDAIFVTSAVKWAAGKPELWRKSLAWLDYNFLVARKSNPRYIIVGSYDDIRERNGWLICNTTNSASGMQMRDKFGAITTDGYYNRVKEWIDGGPVSYISGGLIKDGCYIVKNKKSGLSLQMRLGNGFAGSVLEQSATPVFPNNRYFWFYHLGNNIYRIISLPSALSLTPVDGSLNSGVVIEQNWDQDVNSQK